MVDAARDTSARPTAPQKLAAWGVHLFTASGAIVAVLAFVAMARGDLSAAAVWMLLAFSIDAVDGSMARAARVSEMLPGIDGRRLDDMIDFLNYVVVAVVFMLAAGKLLSFWWVAPPLLASAYGFSQVSAKTDDHFFLGWPSYWNVVAIYAWVLNVGAEATTAWVALFSVLVFVPLKYMYPTQSPVLKRETLMASVAWVAALAAACAWPDSAFSPWLAWGSLLFPAWYFGVSMVYGGLQRRGSD
jgi:phosphatidylcholine synthase